MSLRSQVIKKLLRRQFAGWSDGPIAEQRARQEKSSRFNRLPADVRCSQVTANGVSAEWIEGSAADAGVILYLHGGAYALGSINGHREWIARLANATQTRALAINYRLAPEHPFPAALEDTLSTYNWLLDQGAKLETWDRFARTPFLVAARMADVESMEKLLAKGADIHATDRFGQNAVHLVIEGLRTTITDTKYLRETGQYRNLDKSPEEIEQSLQRAVQALIFLGKAGVDLDAQAKETPKNTKKSPSPYASLPRAPRSALSASPGERWTDHLARRQAEDRLLPDSTLPRFKEGLLEVRLAAVLPPEPEELSLEPVLDVPVPRVTRRPRL